MRKTHHITVTKAEAMGLRRFVMAATKTTKTP
jgi:hypothetical protein